jgi:hypothetical protein
MERPLESVPAPGIVEKEIKRIIDDNGIPFINWRLILPDLADTPAEKRQSIFDAMILDWLGRLAKAAGTPGTILESTEMTYFTYFEGDVAQDRFAAIKSIRSGIIDTFGDIYPKAYTGKNLIVELKDPQDQPGCPHHGQIEECTTALRMHISRSLRRNCCC